MLSNSAMGSLQPCKLQNSKYVGELQTLPNEIVPPSRQTMIHVTPQVLQGRIVILQNII